MMFNAIFKNIFNSKVFYWIMLSLFPAHTLGNYIRTSIKLRKLLNDQRLFFAKHNCVVMFDHKRGISGWPVSLNTSIKDLTNPNIYGPILYFIRTAKKSLDISMMVINSEVIARALITAHKQGILIRIVLDFDYSQNRSIKTLEKLGIQIIYYVCPAAFSSSILHYKYMLKDYSDDDGYVYMGSQNCTSIGFKNNYDCVCLTTDHRAVKAIHENFEETWKYLDHISKTSSYAKARLNGLRYI